MSLFTNKQTRWARPKLRCKDYQFVTLAKFEAHGSYIINDSSIFSFEFWLPVLNSPESPLLTTRGHGDKLYLGPLWEEGPQPHPPTHTPRKPLMPPISLQI